MLWGISMMFTLTKLLEDHESLCRLIEEHRILKEAIENSPTNFCVYDQNDRLLAWNKAYEALHQTAFNRHCERAKLGQMTYGDLVRCQLENQFSGDELDLEVTRRVDAQRTASGDPVTRHYANAGYLKIFKYPLPSGAVAGFAINISDLVAREAELSEARQAAEKAEERLFAAIQAMPAAFAIFNAQERLVVCNDTFRNTYGTIADIIRPGVTLETVIRSMISNGYYPEADGREEEWLQSRLNTHRTQGALIEANLHDGRFMRVQSNRTKNGDIVICKIDITELKRSQLTLQKQAEALERANKEVREQALHDALTGLPNRRYLDQYLSDTLEKAAREGIRVGLMHLDLDRFKQVNDTAGHAAGDQILRHTACILRNCSRRLDFIARVGGDEFVIVLNNCPNPEDVADIANRVIRLISKPIEVEGQSCRVGASVGVAIMDNEALSAETLMMNADIALYRVKENGRNGVEFFTSDLQMVTVEKKTIADEILAALERNEFFPIYQPQFSAYGLSLRGLETLCRWQHPQRGVLAPNDFIPIAEEIGVMAEIDRMIFQKAYADIQDLQNAGMAIPKISFNVSARRLLEADLDVQMASLQRFGIDVAIELVELMSLDNLSDAVKSAIDGLKACGIQIEIDDFGSCRASIVALMSVEPHAMKLDRQLIEPIVKSSKHLKLVRAIVEIGEALGIEVIAEGVETDKHVELTRDLGCNILQGYALARPMPRDDLFMFMRNDAKSIPA